MLVRLFKSPDVGLLKKTEENEGIDDDLSKLSSADRHLLGAKHAKLDLGAIITVIKGLVNLG